MNYARFLTATSLRRKPSPIRALTALLARSPPSMISLAGGFPNPELFPYTSAEFTLSSGEKLCFDKETMQKALQYGPTLGQADLLQWLRDLQLRVHSPPTATKPPSKGGMDICVTVGSQDGLCRAFEMCVNPGDNVLIDCPGYAGSVAILSALGCNMLPVRTDGDGMNPEALKEALSSWKPEDAKNPNSDIPRVLYTCPNGANPTGATLSMSRRHEIYKLAQLYDLLILEDDPYFYLQFSQPLASFLSLDVDGRVLRFDSFSKLLSSGLRVGFVTGPNTLVNKIILHMQVSVIHTASMSQMMVSNILHHWGYDGFMKHVEKVVNFYSKQKDCMIESAERHLTGLAEWTEPKAGMFLWLKLLGIQDTQLLIESKAVEKEVVLVPGCAFMPDSSQPSPYVRAAFSLSTPEQIDQGFQRLAELIKEELKT